MYDCLGPRSAMKVTPHRSRRRSIFSIVFILVGSVFVITRFCIETAVLGPIQFGRWSKKPEEIKLFKLVVGTTGRPFRVYDGFHVFLAADSNYTLGSASYPRTCKEWTKKCQMEDWTAMMQLVLATNVFEKSKYVWILEDDTYPCPGAAALIERIVVGNPEIQMLNTGIGASGWVLGESAFREVLNLLIEKEPAGPDLGVAGDMRPLPTRLAVNLITHTTLQKTMLGHVHDTPIYAGCFEYQTVSGWYDYDLFDWSKCAGYDVYPCPEGTTKILHEQQIGYVGNTYTAGESYESLKTWIVKSSGNYGPNHKQLES